ncbi:MAG: beta-mannosidase [Bacteroidales bacterium]|nr:beta-mannosidase [Bacteroidales bacterium]
MKRGWILAALVLAACSSGNKKPMETPKDQLVHRLFAYAENSQIAYGHQDDLAYGHSWCVTDWENDPLDRSDVKKVTGAYPVVMGFDLGGIELGNEANLDGVPFGLIRKAALTHAQRGGIVTFSWHPRNPLTGGDAWDVSSKEVVKAVLQGGQKHTEFMLWLKRAADFIESLGPEVAVIWRPWHENTGSWFWWGRDLCTENDYRELFRLTWVYFTKERGLENLLWCYSPNGPIDPKEYMGRYPGDDFVDILGVDFYEFVGPDGVQESSHRFAGELREMLVKLSAFGQEHHKLICLSETGMEGLPDLHWWTEVLYPAIHEFPISYVLTWRNAHDKPGHFYGPWEGFAGAADFKAFSELDSIVLLDE